MANKKGFSTAKGFNPTDGTGLEITKDENGVLRMGDIIIPQRKVLWSGAEKITSSGKEFSFDESLVGKTLEFEYSTLSVLDDAPLDGQDTIVHKIIKVKIHHTRTYGYFDELEYVGSTGNMMFRLSYGASPTDNRITVKLNKSADITDIAYFYLFSIVEVIE